MGNWIAHCITCNQTLEDCPNGNWAQAHANKHKTENPEHKVVVGMGAKVNEDATT